MSDASIPGVPFDPSTTGPLDLLVSGVRRVHGWAVENSTALIASGVVILLAQIGVWAHYGVWFLRPPTLPNWLLVAIGTVIFFAPIAILAGVLLGRGLYTDDTVMISILSASDGDQRIKHVSPERFENLRIVNQNGEERGRSYLERISVNGRTAYEVDSFWEEGNTLVASSMAGRTNQEIRSDRLSIAKIKTDMEKEVDEAVEMKANARDIIRERSASVINWIIRTAQGATIPDGAHLFDEMQESLEAVEPLAQMDQSPFDDPDAEASETSSSTSGDDDEDADIYERAERNGTADAAEVPADD